MRRDTVAYASRSKGNIILVVARLKVVYRKFICYAAESSALAQ